MNDPKATPTSSPLPIALLKALNDKLSAEVGINYSADRFSDLYRHFKTIAKEFEFRHVDDCIKWLTDHQLTDRQLSVIASHLTIGETYFFREPALFDHLSQEILPELITARRKGRLYLNLWSAGCASGEEPYTLAIILSKLIPDWKDWSINIFASDLNHHFLAKAKMAKYTNWSMRACQPDLVARYFKKDGESAFIFDPSLRSMVQFQKLNLARPDDYHQFVEVGSMDIILCRNVFIYFSEETAHKVTAKMSEFLTPKGYLFVSPSELSAVVEDKYHKLTYSGGTYFEKSDGKPRLKAVKASPVVQPLLSKPKPMPLAAAKSGTSPFDFNFIDIKPKLAVPAELDAKFKKAQKLFEQGAWQEVAQVLLGLYEHQYKEAEVASMLSRSYANRNWLVEALAWNTIAIEKDNLNYLHYYLRASILEARGDTEEAVDCFRQTLFLNPESVIAQFAVSNLLIKIGRRTKAKSHLKSAQRLLLDYEDDDIIPDSEGLTAGSLKLIVNSLSESAHD